MAQEASAFGALLRRHRQAAGLTQEELAERARLSTRAVLDLERGARLVPRRDTVRLLAAALTLTPAECAAFEATARRAPPPDPTLRSSSGTPPRRAGRPDLPLVGRVRELLLLDQHRAGEGPSVLLLAGEPGMGKTRLLQEAMTGRAGRRDGPARWLPTPRWPGTLCAAAPGAGAPHPSSAIRATTRISARVRLAGAPAP